MGVGRMLGYTSRATYRAAVPRKQHNRARKAYVTCRVTDQADDLRLHQLMRWHLQQGFCKRLTVWNLA